MVSVLKRGSLIVDRWIESLMKSKESFGQRHFGGVDLGDERRNRRLPQLVDQFVRHPHGTLPQKLPVAADQEAFYRLCQAPEVTHEAVLAPHQAQVLKKLQATKQFLLVIHDATEFDFSSRKSLKRLGQIGNGGGRGYVVHQSLVVDPRAGTVLGLASQILHRRIKVPKNESVAKKRQRSSRESRLWLKGTQTLPGRKPIVDVCDRGADTFEFLEHEIRSGRTFVIRAKFNRWVQSEAAGADTSVQKLLSLTKSLPVLATSVIPVQIPLTQRTKSKPTLPVQRTAQLSISAAPICIQSPHVRRGDHLREPLSAWVVRIWESNPPQGSQPLQWVLLTNHPIESADDALLVKSWYEWRWIIEEYHKGQKTGCAIEELQFRDEDRLKPALAILSIVALTLLQLRDAIRDPKAKRQRAMEVIDAEAILVLSQWTSGCAQPNWSLYEFSIALAKLGGYRHRKNNPPGWQTLWRGHTKLEIMLDGVKAIQNYQEKTKKRCAKS